MQFKFLILSIFSFLFFQGIFAQYSFEGYIDETLKDGEIFLSLVEDYRKLSGVYNEQILVKTKADTTGYFSFTGNNLPADNRMYRIHVDTCPNDAPNTSHIMGHCKNSKEIIFIANNTSTLQLPTSFANEVFCKVVSEDKRAEAFLKIDSLRNDMHYAFNSYRSEANRKINTEKWFTIFQQYGEQLQEPLAELYIYSFLSDRSSLLHTYYLEDLKNNNYYQDLLLRLQEKYPDTGYTQQYEAELIADQYLINSISQKAKVPWWLYFIGIVSILSIVGNFYFFGKWKKAKEPKITDQNLSNQEKKVLDLILDNKTNKEIATSLFVSVSTVKTHINNVYRKLNVSSREEVKTLFSK